MYANAHSFKHLKISMVWDEHGIQVPFGEKIIGFRLKERGQISSLFHLSEQRFRSLYRPTSYGGASPSVYLHGILKSLNSAWLAFFVGSDKFR